MQLKYVLLNGCITKSILNSNRVVDWVKVFRFVPERTRKACYDKYKNLLRATFLFEIIVVVTFFNLTSRLIFQLHGRIKIYKIYSSKFKRKSIEDLHRFTFRVVISNCFLDAFVLLVDT